MDPLNGSPKRAGRDAEIGKAAIASSDHGSDAKADHSTSGSSSETVVPLDVAQFAYIGSRPAEKKKRARRRKKKGHRTAPVMQDDVADGAAIHTAESTQDNKVPLRKKRRRRRKKPFFLQSQPARQGGDGADSKLKIAQLDNGHLKKHDVVGHASRANHAAQHLYHGSNGPLYAALDLGTNNCRLLIATPTKPGFFRVVDAFSRIVRLGEGLSTSGRLSDDAMDRAVEALKVCAAKLAQKNIKSKRLIATEACRSAKNGAAFIDRVYRETGLKLEVVDRETEARLAVSGCGTLVERHTDAIVLFDIGGGSSEIALIDISAKRSSRLAEHITAWTSLPVGVVSLAEKFGGEDVSNDDFEKMKAYVRSLLDNFADRYKLGKLVESPHFHLLGTSGTVTTLAGLHLDLERYDRRRIDGVWLQSGDVTRMTERLLSWNLEQRMANPCIGRERADLVLAGCAILEAIREVWPSERLRVADRGLREGILTELMSRDGVWRKRRRSLYGERQRDKQKQSDNRNERERL